jgi:hypothetical protein
MNNDDFPVIGNPGFRTPDYAINKDLPQLPKGAPGYLSDLVVLTYQDEGFDLQRILKLSRSAAEREAAEARLRKGIRPLKRIVIPYSGPEE